MVATRSLEVNPKIVIRELNTGVSYKYQDIKESGKGIEQQKINGRVTKVDYRRVLTDVTNTTTRKNKCIER